MKPRTNFQKEVAELSKSLPKITKAQREYAFDKCFEHIGKTSKKGVVTCMECGHQWKSEIILLDSIDGCVCPNCGKRLKVTNTRKRVFKSMEYFSIITKKDKYQIIRFFSTRGFWKVGKPAEYDITEVVQRWISPDGKSEVIARSRCLSPYYYDTWNLCSPMEIRRNNQYRVYDISPYKTYPRKSLIPEIVRNGYKKPIQGISAYDTFTAILTNPKMETLLKTGQNSLFAHFIRKGNISEYWNSIKICIRNGYNVSDASIWTDHIDLLKDFGKDINNAKYVCPKDLTREHDKNVQKRQQQRKREELIKQRETINKYESQYKAEKGRFFGLLFTDDAISIRVLESVREFAEEGVLMHHCVFVNKYYLKKDSLIFSATIDGKRIETVEVSLDRMQVVQSRGVFNSNTVYHDRIINLVNRNMNQIAKRMAV